MTKDELILQMLTEIKKDITDIKKNFVIKEVCDLKCQQQNKKIAMISGSITGFVTIMIFAIKMLIGK